MFESSRRYIQYRERKKKILEILKLNDNIISVIGKISIR